LIIKESTVKNVLWFFVSWLNQLINLTITIFIIIYRLYNIVYTVYIIYAHLCINVRQEQYFLFFYRDGIQSDRIVSQFAKVYKKIFFKTFFNDPVKSNRSNRAYDRLPVQFVLIDKFLKKKICDVLADFKCKRLGNIEDTVSRMREEDWLCNSSHANAEYRHRLKKRYIGWRVLAFFYETT